MALQLYNKLIPLAEVAEPLFLFYFFLFLAFMLNFHPLLSKGYLFSVIQGLDQHCSSFMNASVQWSKKVSSPGTLEGRFSFFHGESKAIYHGTAPLLTLCYHH